jgi:endonuclease III
MDRMDLIERAEDIHRRLVEFYKEPLWHSSLLPLDQLVQTILSQNTNDSNSGRAFES